MHIHMIYTIYTHTHTHIHTYVTCMYTHTQVQVGRGVPEGNIAASGVGVCVGLVHVPDALKHREQVTQIIYRVKNLCFRVPDALRHREQVTQIRHTCKAYV